MRKSWFESLFDPFPMSPVERPPDRLFAFYRYFIHPVRWLVVVVLLLSLASTVIEMSLYVFLGKIVDWAAATPREQFFSTHGWQLAGMVVVVLVLRPVIALLQRGFNNLSLVPTLTAMVRWQNYRYVLRQSLSFFQNDFAGRIAQKVMQTGPSLRETVGSLIDGIWTLVVYVGGTVWLFVGLDPWLIAPVAIWLALYVLTIWRLVPPVRQRSAAVAEASSGLSGRIVDSYTNIQSVKLFARAEREDDFVLDGFRNHYRGLPRLCPHHGRPDGFADRDEQRAHRLGLRPRRLAVEHRLDHRRGHRHRHLAGAPPQPDVEHDPAGRSPRCSRTSARCRTACRRSAGPMRWSTRRTRSR